MLCVAKGTLQVAAGEAYEKGRGAGKSPLTLQGIEYFVYLACHAVEEKVIRLYRRSLVNFIDCDIPFALLHLGAEAVFDIVHNPAGDVFGGGIEGEDIVEDSMVEA